jgi:hypothetical protein
MGTVSDAHRDSRAMSTTTSAAVDQQHGNGQHNYEKYDIG